MHSSRWSGNAPACKGHSVVKPVRLTLALVFAVAVSAVVPTGAFAATKIGQVFAPSAAVGATMFQTGVESGVGYTVPASGVITSWSFLPDSSGATLKLKAARKNDDGTYTVVGESENQTVTGATGTFPTRIPVKAGDVIGSAGTSGNNVV